MRDKYPQRYLERLYGNLYKQTKIITNFADMMSLNGVPFIRRFIYLPEALVLIKQ